MYKYLFILLAILTCTTAAAHPMPNPVVNLSVQENSIRGEAKMPYAALQSALGNQSLPHIGDAFFTDYFTHHIRAVSAGQSWTTTINTVDLTTGHDAMTGDDREVVVQFTMKPPAGADMRNFTFDYDALIHQVVTHPIMVFVEQDWRNGIQAIEPARPIGVIQMDVPTGQIVPLEVNLARGSWWTGFGSMVRLGMLHIKEGADHLLFLLVLLLPAMLVTHHKRWAQYGGLRYSITRLFRIVTAFTIGHAVTLLTGSLGWIHAPAQLIEALIALSILVFAIHAVYPVFPGRESLIAAGFGLVHGMSFASMLTGLSFNIQTLLSSMLGFSLGIELMQLLIILLVVPWLILLSQTTVYTWVRITGASLTGIAASAWIMERISGNPNAVTRLMEGLSSYTTTGIILLAICSLLLYGRQRYGKWLRHRWYGAPVIPLHKEGRPRSH